MNEGARLYLLLQVATSISPKHVILILGVREAASLETGAL